jgi:hypothetical protein
MILLHVSAICSDKVIKKKHINKTCVTNRIQHVVLLYNKNEHVCVDVKSKMDMYVSRSDSTLYNR